MPDKQARYKPGVPTQINSRKNVEPFGEQGWLPAGEGCVRTTSRVYFYRARRHDLGLEWQVDDRGRTWYLNPYLVHGYWANEARAALDHFWPQTERPTTFQLQRGDVKETWVRDGDHIRSDQEGHIWRQKDGRVRVTWSGAKDGALYVDFTRHYTVSYKVVAALAPEWIDRPKDGQSWIALWSRAVAETLTKFEAPKDEPIDWQFRSTPDKVDIARCLREAYDAGAREVTIYKDGVSNTYIHEDVRFLVKSWWFQTQFRAQVDNWAMFCLNRIDQWFRIQEPALERARAWEAEQKAKAETKIVVKVKGVR